MGQKQSRRVTEPTDTPTTPIPERYPSSGRILPGAYIIRNRASGTVLHVVDHHEYQTGEQCDVVGWTQEPASLETLAKQIWWVEWDDVYQSYVISNVTKGVVLDIMGSRALIASTGKKTEEKGTMLCARPRVRSLASARSSIRSSASSLDVIRREDLLPERRNGSMDGLALTEKSVGDRIMSQRWILKRMQPTSESFSIHNLLHPSIVLDLDWGRTDNNTKVQLRSRTGVNHQQWNFIIPPIPSMSPPIGSWVLFRNRSTGAFLHHADRDYPPAAVRLPRWDGISSRREFWGLHWCFIRVESNDGTSAADVRWYLKNRLTGTLLEHVGSRRKGDSVKAESHLLGTSKEWRAHLMAPGPDTDGQTGTWAFENVESGCVLDFYGKQSIQCYTPGINNVSKQWKIVEASTPFVDYGAANLKPPPEDVAKFFPTLSQSCTTLAAASNPASASLLPLIMPSSGCFLYIESAIWPLPACAPSSRDVLGHEERSFFELLGRIETQLMVAGPHIATVPTITASTPTSPVTEAPPVLPPRPKSMSISLPLTGFFDLVQTTAAKAADTSSLRSRRSSISSMSSALLLLTGPPSTTKKRILPAAEGWTSWALGYSKGGNMTHWNNLVESEVVRHADRRDRYIVSFYEAVVIIRDLLEKFHERQNVLLDAAGKGGNGVAVLPSRIVWLVGLASLSLDKILRLRKLALEADFGSLGSAFGTVDALGNGIGGIGMTRVGETEAQKAAKEVNAWVIKELERVRIGWKAVEGMCTGSAGIVH